MKIDFQKKKILLTGANGLLGQKISKLCSERGLNLIATGRGESRLPASWNINYKTMDISNKENVAELFGREKPEIVIHAAAMTNVDQCEEDKSGCLIQNVDAVQYLCDEAEKLNAHFIHLSTDFIFDGKTGPLTEEEEPGPVNFYGESKLLSEKIVKSYKSKWTIARTVLVYGITENMSRSNIILWVKNSLESGKPIQVVDDQWRTPTLAEDLATGCLLIAEKEKDGIFNLSGKDFLSPYDMAIATAEYFNLDKSLITRTDSTKFQQTAARPLKTGFIIDKAVKELAYSPHSFEEGIKLLDSQLVD